jgi:hypothetical protein
MDGSAKEAGMSGGKIDTTNIANPEARAFVEGWTVQHSLNRAMYDAVPEDRFDHRPTEGFPTPRENLAYQIKVHQNFLKCIGEGTLVFGKHYEEIEKELEGKTRDQLLAMWDLIDRQVVEAVAAAPDQLVGMPWGAQLPAYQAAGISLRDNEVYHLQSNRGLLRNMGITEPPEVSAKWG